MASVLLSKSEKADVDSTGSFVEGPRRLEAFHGGLPLVSHFLVDHVETFLQTYFEEHKGAKISEHLLYQSGQAARREASH